ncbi:MAG: hypothetical protein ABIY55_19565 [Kofleriaceae bacterium]
MSLHRFVVLALVLAACRSPERRPPPAEQTATPKLAPGTQAELARELDDAEPRNASGEVRHRWQGQRLHWTATRYRAMCGAEAACNVAVFPVQRPARHGWMPKLGFAPGQYDALAAACGAREQCDFTFEGTLVELDASGDHATKLRFADVTVVAAKLAAN